MPDSQLTQRYTSCKCAICSVSDETGQVTSSPPLRLLHVCRGRLPDWPLDVATLYRLIGYFADDSFTPLFAHTVQSALQGVQNALHAADLIIDGDRRLVYCCNTLPGHHASYRSYGGYCYLNSSAAAAAHMHSRSHEPVGILDLDYHAANGTRDIVVENQTSIKWNQVFLASIHVGSDSRSIVSLEYPQEVAPEAHPNVATFLLPTAKTICGDVYAERVSMACEWLRTKNVKHLVISFGTDTLGSDPERSHAITCSISVPDYARFASIIKSLYVPIVVIQEGGYDLSSVGHAVTTFLTSLQ
jgi:acetoin utilization deacetylase AcuC-like enzyme